MIGVPPSLAGGVKEILADKEFALAVISAIKLRGGVGTAKAVTAVEANESVESPTLFVALTWKL